MASSEVLVSSRLALVNSARSSETKDLSIMVDVREFLLLDEYATFLCLYFLFSAALSLKRNVEINYFRLFVS